MALIDIESLQRPIPPDRFSLFALGFRPFFLLAGISAPLLVAAWLMVIFGVGAPSSYYPPSLWHGHEMIFGFAVAVIAGFLLTAVRNWTSLPTPTGHWLAVLAAIWLLGRILPLIAMPPLWVALVDLFFLPLLALAVAVPIFRSGKRPQYVFVILLALLFIANLMIHAELTGLWRGGASRGMGLAVNTVILMIVIMGGRVIPFFTERGVEGAKPVKHVWLERLALGSMVAVLLAEWLLPLPWLIVVLSALAMFSHGQRLRGWLTPGAWRVPLVWVLHVGYAWLVLGFALKAAGAAGWLYEPAALHAFTAGGIGVLTLGMMARVALGHTGRPLAPAPVMSRAFVLINVAALVRVGASFLPQAYIGGLALSALMWFVAFAIFVFVYAPILIRARVDGRPG